MTNREHYFLKCRELEKENEQLKSEHKVLHTQYQDLKRFVTNNFDEYQTQEKLNRKITKLVEKNEQLKQDRKRLIGYLWKYKSMDMEEIEEYILSRELLDEYGEAIMNE